MTRPLTILSSRATWYRSDRSQCADRSRHRRGLCRSEAQSDVGEPSAWLDMLHGAERKYLARKEVAGGRIERMRGMIRETYLCDGLVARVASAPECLDLSHRVRARASCSFFVKKTGENRGALWRRSASSLSKRADELKHQPRRLAL